MSPGDLGGLRGKPPRVETLRVFKIIDGLDDHREILVDTRPLNNTPVRVDGAFLGILFVAPTNPRTPKWVGYFRHHADLSDMDIKAASASAVLLVKRPAGVFAITFGYGRYLLRDDVFDPRFGLRVTLNAIEPTALRSIDHRRLDAVGRHTREQVGKLTSINSFGVDVARDLLRAATGKPKEEADGSQMAGADALAVTARIPLEQLASHLDRWAVLSDLDTYRVTFPWVDNVHEVRSSGLKTCLDHAVVELLRAGETDRVFLGVPEVLDWAMGTSFFYEQRHDATSYADAEIGDFYREFGRVDRLTSAELRSKRLYLGDQDGEREYKSWTIFKCLVAEVDHGGKLFVLSEGSWYEVSQDYKQEVENEVAAIAPSNLTLPPYPGGKESDFNAKAARRSQGALCLVDGRNVPCGNRSLVEPCDLFSADRQMIHVKRRGSSSVLSHLFAQGIVAGEMFAHDRQFRQGFANLLSGGHRVIIDTATPNASSYEVSYVVLGTTNRTRELPFFSKVTLRNALRTLGGLGFKVTLTNVPLRPSRP